MPTYLAEFLITRLLPASLIRMHYPVLWYQTFLFLIEIWRYVYRDVTPCSVVDLY